KVCWSFKGNKFPPVWLELLGKLSGAFLLGEASILVASVLGELGSSLSTFVSKCNATIIIVCQREFSGIISLQISR
ncbi:hypothetical protein GIB67_039511, partial [Kingdonia uniflora]